ncbi:hypothetical protein Sjap_008195 [Stephania japonica]|uniref:Uncharacterized protein n=1 Tax=Stephania japonica TaxID=461633 RepID=A0AAP0JP17_9MAGN
MPNAVWRSSLSPKKSPVLAGALKASRASRAVPRIPTVQNWFLHFKHYNNNINHHTLNTKTNPITVEVCDFCREYFHPTYACPYHPSTTQQHLQEDVQHINSRLLNSESQVTTTLTLIDEEELSLQPIFNSEETVNAATLESVKFDEFSIMDEYLSEPEETLDVSLHEQGIIIAQSTYDEVEQDIEVVSERPEELQKESREDQPLVLVKPPTLL